MNAKLQALRTADWWARKRVVEEISGLPEDRYLDVLASWLRNGEDDLSRNAAMEVYRALGSRATAALRGLIRDADPEVRVFSANLMGDIGDAACLPDLGEAAKDAEENVRIAAVEALGKIGDRRAVGLIVPAMEDTAWVVMAGIHALGRIGGPEACAVLHGLLDRGEVRGMTCEALEHAGACSSLGHLAPYAGRGEIGARAVRAMVAIAERECTDIPREVFAGILHVLMDLSVAPDASVRQAALAALGWTGDPRAVRHLLEALDEEPLRENAINGLLGLGDRAASGITEALRSGGTQRGILANILATVGDRALLLEFAGDRDPEVRTEAALALGSVQTPAAQAALDKLAADAVAEVQAAARLSLGRVKDGGEKA